MSTIKCPDWMTWEEFAAEEADPEPHPGEPPCGHESCNDVWRDLNCMEDRLEDWGDGKCVEVYKWEVHIGIKSRMWLEEEPAQKESNEDLFLFKAE